MSQECGCSVLHIGSETNPATAVYYKISYCPLHANARRLLEAAKLIADPTIEGFCDDCGGGEQLDLKDIGTKHIWVHQKECWYRQLQDAIEAASKEEVK